ncbi:MAG: Asp-tRNA(Asn)/Glu-tRNA(Gln) amidotransferase subunit GatC [Betaproteobacteria bacterium]
MELQPDDLKRLARLARIAVSDDEVMLLKGQLNGIFGLIDELQSVNTGGIEPLAHPLDIVQPMAQRLREDRVSEFDQRSANLANAPAQENGLFLVPRVIE